ncbi:MAG: zinc-binding dehydrogenase [Pseudomonadota bacterium]
MAPQRRLGVHWAAYTRHHKSVVDAAHEEIVTLYEQGSIRPIIAQTMGLEPVPQALNPLENRNAVGRSSFLEISGKAMKGISERST